MIAPPSLWEWVWNNTTWYTGVHYHYYLYETRQPTATDCLTGDPLLDQQALRQMLDSLWRLAGGDGPDAQKIERAGYLFEDSTGAVTFRISDINSLPPNPDNACRAANQQPFPPYGWTALAGVHVHPFADGDPTDICHPSGGTGHTYNGHDNLGFSTKKGDLDRLAADASMLGAGLAGMYVMDKDQISFAPVGSTKKNIRQKGRSTPRTQGSGCRIA